MSYYSNSRKIKIFETHQKIIYLFTKSKNPKETLDKILLSPQLFVGMISGVGIKLKKTVGINNIFTTHINYTSTFYEIRPYSFFSRMNFCLPQQRCMRETTSKLWPGMEMLKAHVTSNLRVV